jgi:carboxyl-terminal processing protease
LFQRIFRATVLAAMAACALLALPAAAADAPRPMDRILRARMQVLLKGTVEAIEEHYYDPSFKGNDLKALAAQARERIEQAGSYDLALAAIADLFNQLDDTHTHFFPPWQTVQVRYGWGWQMIGDKAMVTNVLPGSDAERQGVHPGDRLVSINGLPANRETAPTLGYIFYSLRPQPGLHVELLDVQGQRRELDVAASYKLWGSVVDLSLVSGDAWAQLDAARDRDLVRMRPGVAEVGHDTLVVRLPGFTQPARLLGYFSKLASRAVLILDLRGNGGGRTDALASIYGLLTAKPVPIATFHARTESTMLMSGSSGSQAFTGRVFVLVDSRSASASEIMARTVQLQERGTVIGDRTAGAVMAGRTYEVTAGGGENIVVAQAYVTVADVVMPDGTRLEKKGVLPDFEVLPSAGDLAGDRDPALALALKFAGHDMDAASAWRLQHDANSAGKHEDD